MAPKVLVAPTAFKGTLDAFEAADALVEAVAAAIPNALVIRCPIADGGDGTADILVEHLGGESVPVEVTSSSGGRIHASYGWLPTGVAVVEFAKAAGVTDSIARAASATSRGVGELISAALDRAPRRLIVGMGGSATSDAGAGLLQAVGVGMFDSSGRAIEPGAEGLLKLDRIDGTFRDKRIFETEILVACDVNNPLLGPTGAAQTFSPQKGATGDEVETIEAALARFAEIAMRDAGKWVGEVPRGGAAGGAAAGMSALLGAELRDGFELVSQMIEFEDLIAESDLLLIGEGSLDRQSLAGKAPIGAARLAKRFGVPVWAFAGRISLATHELQAEGISMWADLSELTGESEAGQNARNSLVEVASRMLARGFGPPK